VCTTGAADDGNAAGLDEGFEEEKEDLGIFYFFVRQFILSPVKKHKL
jgi:hypothetical protein